MAMATSSAATSSAAAAGLQQTQELSLNLRSSSHVVLPFHPRCKPLSAGVSEPSSRWCSNSPLSVRAVATTSQESTQKAAAGQVTKYHFLVANAKFMLDEEEHFQELMKERLRNFEERNRQQDFWLVIEPEFLDSFPDITNRLKRPAVALVSTDELWITFMKLRLDRVLRGEIEAETLTEALKSSPVELNFEKPQTWTAPYSKYEGPWWTPFLPPAEQ